MDDLADLSAPFSPAARSQVVVAPDRSGPGAWAGAPSALLHDGVFYLAYRLRRPIGQGRGFANIVARSRDGVRFETVATLGKEAFGAESLERPALAVTADGTWRAYISCATPGTKHWRVDLVEAATPRGWRRPRRARSCPDPPSWPSRTRSSSSTRVAGTCGPRATRSRTRRPPTA